MSGNTCHIYDILLVFGNALASKPGQATPWQAWQLRVPFQVQHAKTECGAAPVREVGWQELSLVMERMENPETISGKLLRILCKIRAVFRKSAGDSGRDFVEIWPGVGETLRRI